MLGGGEPRWATPGVSRRGGDDALPDLRSAGLTSEGLCPFGIQLPIQAQSSIFVEEWERSAGPAELLRIARAADQAGLLYVAVCDHVGVPGARVEQMGSMWADPVSTLGFLAASTSRVRLLTHVYVPAYRPALASAKAFSTLDWLSGGRLVIGVGAGHVEEEFAALGAEFSRRGRLLDDAIHLLASTLETGTCGDLVVEPRVVQQPRPPIWVGGSSPAAIRRAARLGDGWLPQGPATEEGIVLLREERERVRPGEPITIGSIAPFLISFERRSPAEIVERLRGVLVDGVDHVQVRFRSASVDQLVDSIGRFGQDVAPAFAS